MSLAGFEPSFPASVWPQNHTLGFAATGIRLNTTGKYCIKLKQETFKDRLSFSTSAHVSVQFVQSFHVIFHPNPFEFVTNYPLRTMSY